MDRDRVMAEMKQVGLGATEIGPDGYLPTDPGELRETVARFALQVVRGFEPAVLYRQDRFEAGLDYFERASRQLADAGAHVLVLGPSSHLSGYDTSVTLDESEWSVFFRNLQRVQDIAGQHGLSTGLHPHWGMAVERPEHVDRVLESSDVGICLDTGHLFIGGADPVEVARKAAGRVNHVHVKDVRGDLAEQVRSGLIPFRQATLEGMFPPAGDGDVDLAGVIEVLERDGFDGWYVLEQDVSLEADPAPGEGPVLDAEKSVRYLRSLAAGA
jgi:inosose dehydratase